MTEREKWIAYEAAKKQIAATAQNSDEYEARIERLKERLKL